MYFYAIYNNQTLHLTKTRLTKIKKKSNILITDWIFKKYENSQRCGLCSIQLAVISILLLLWLTLNIMILMANLTQSSPLIDLLLH